MINISLPALKILPVDMNLDVAKRLLDLENWISGWQIEDSRLSQQIQHLDPGRARPMYYEAARLVVCVVSWPLRLPNILFTCLLIQSVAWASLVCVNI